MVRWACPTKALANLSTSIALFVPTVLVASAQPARLNEDAIMHVHTHTHRHTHTPHTHTHTPERVRSLTRSCTSRKHALTSTLSLSRFLALSSQDASRPLGIRQWGTKGKPFGRPLRPFPSQPAHYDPQAARFPEPGIDPSIGHPYSE